MSLTDTAIAGTSSSLGETTGRFKSWWLAELAASYSDFQTARTSERALIHGNADGFSLFVLHKNDWREKASLTADASSRAQNKFKRAVSKATSRRMQLPFRLNAEDTLKRILKVPEAAADVIGPVVQNQIQRLAPWPESECLFGFKSLGPGEDGQIDVLVVLARRDTISAAQDRMETHGISISRVEFADVETNELVTLHSAGYTPSEDAVRKVSKTLKVAAAIAVAMIGASMFLDWSTKAQLNSVNAELSSLRAEIAEAAEASGDASGFMRNGAALLKRKQDHPSTLALLDTLSRYIPRSAYLTGLEIRQDKVHLTGKARNAASLVAAIEKSKLLKEVGFTAPTIRLPAERREAFTISATIVSAPDAGDSSE